jgi:predicted membrane protein
MNSKLFLKMMKIIHSNFLIFAINKVFFIIERAGQKKRRKRLDGVSFFARHNAFASCSLFINYKPLASSIKALYFYYNYFVSWRLKYASW